MSVSSWSAEASRTRCDYYLQVESIFRCGPSGYVLGYAAKMCQKYLKVERQMGPNVRWWFPRVRFCLQQKLQELPKRSCQQIKHDAYKSHIPCYLNTGFCKLTFSEQLEIIEVTGLDILNPDSLGIALQIEFQCNRLGLN